MKYSLYLGNILGVKVYVHWTFVFLIGWIVISGVQKDLPVDAILWVLGLTLTVFVCIFLHELAHALVAKRFKVQTKHITLLPIGGIAQLESIPDRPKHELLIALAGPVVNLIIGIALVPVIDVHLLIQLESMMTINSTNFLFTLMVINFWLAVFNLIPAFPMDGGRVLRALLSFWINRDQATKIAAGIGQLFGLIFFFGGFFYSPMFIFIGLLVFVGGQYEYALVDTMRLLQSFTIRDVLMREVPTMENNITLKQAGEHLLASQNTTFVVLEQGKPIGTINRDEIILAVHELGENASISKVKNQKLNYANPSMALDQAWKLMHDRKTSVLLIGNNGDLDGIVDEDNISEFIQLKSGAKLRGAAA